MTRILYSRRQILVWGGLLLLLLLPAFVSLGLWQWNKAQGKLARQAELDARSQGAVVAMPAQAAPADALRYYRFVLRGEYDAGHQILIDNRVQAERAGYHVVTPLKLAGSDLHVLVNRGWVPAPPDHRQHPSAPPPIGQVEITGIAVVPGERFFTLGPPAPAAGTAWEEVWQNLDLQRFRASVAYPLQPVVLLLDTAAPGGYVRDWPRPDERAEQHLSYAFQWFGFALASVGIWLYFLLRRQ